MTGERFRLDLDLVESQEGENGPEFSAQGLRVVVRKKEDFESLREGIENLVLSGNPIVSFPLNDQEDPDEWLRIIQKILVKIQKLRSEEDIKNYGEILSGRASGENRYKPQSDGIDIVISPIGQ